MPKTQRTPACSSMRTIRSALFIDSVSSHFRRFHYGDAEDTENALVQIVQPLRSVQAVQNVFEPESSACSAPLRLISNANRIDNVLHGADDGKHGQFSRLGIFRRNVFDVHVELAEFTFDVDVVAV